MKKLMSALLTTLFLACTQSQALADSTNPVRECDARIKSKDELKILNGKIELIFSGSPTLEMMANYKVPNQKEKEAIALWIEEQKKCKQLGDEWFTSARPEWVALIDRAYSDMFFLAADLYGGKINYGAFAKGQVKINDDLKISMASLKQQLRQQDEAKQDAHSQQQAMEERRLQQERVYQAQQQAINRQQTEAAKSAATTNLGLELLKMGQPRTLGNPSVNCTTYTRGPYGTINCQ
ncbi:hypothetical protein PG1C_05315 [Rugosibacter aromaticivorans]|uniref:Lysozyme inhibitor LprI N-terminal domain-containing protein n=1 Tax=Rugosibacter aromaticivorans TaxID=1565605 RepID=A0A0C5J7V0_9PROT|nr:hypothetical protein [Rugosibacter aromaticivorans]AJP48030.1 hypothetical protein PG1C_05315 [Rugosibacter aromaticivorans]